MASKPEVLTEVLSLPSPLGLQQSELKDSLIGLQKDAVALPRLKQQAQIEIKDAQTYAEVGAVLSEVRVIKETPKNRLGTFFTIVQKVKTFLDTEANKVKNACTEIEGICLPKMKVWEQKELAETKKEEAQVNKAQEKKGLPPVTVKPTLPTVSGYRRSTVYRASVPDVQKFLAAYRKDPKGPLAEFVIIDVGALNAELRDMKDVKAFMAKYPHTKAWTE